jgi:hypothetical protein
MPLNQKELNELFSLTENNKAEIKYDLFVQALFMKKAEQE